MIKNECSHRPAQLSRLAEFIASSAKIGAHAALQLIRMLAAIPFGCGYGGKRGKYGQILHVHDDDPSGQLIVFGDGPRQKYDAEVHGELVDFLAAGDPIPELTAAEDGSVPVHVHGRTKSGGVLGPWEWEYQ